jgi:hypothetical protein
MSWSFTHYGKPSKLATTIKEKEEKKFTDASEQDAYDSARDMILKTLAANTNDATTMYVQAMGHAGGGFCQSQVIVDSQPYILQPDRERREGTVSDRPAPQAPFDVRICISGDDWAYVRRTAQRIADFISEREPDSCQLVSGGAGGSHYVQTATREVSVEKFHAELQEWMESQRKPDQKEHHP